jgi:hypothetical protein
MSKYSSHINKRKSIITVSEVISKKYDDIHNQLYERALSSYMDANNMNSTYYRTIEIKSSYYNEPSSVKIIERTPPYKTTIVDLTEYWSDYIYSNTLSYLKIDDDITTQTAEVKYKDYVRGTAEMESRLTGVKYKTDINKLPLDVKEYPDDHAMSTTFGYKVQNKIYGK